MKMHRWHIIPENNFKQQCLLGLLILCLPTTNTKELRFLGLLPMTGDGWNGGVSCLPAVKMALDDVNRNDDILTDYNVTYKWIDTKSSGNNFTLRSLVSCSSNRYKNQEKFLESEHMPFSLTFLEEQPVLEICNEGVAVYKMFQALYGDPTYKMVLGGGCSVASEGTAQVSHLWNLTQFSFASSSPILSDRKRFPKFFRLALPDQKHNPARIDLMKEFNWKKVATINQALEFFSSVIDDFVKKVYETNITILSQEIFMNDPMTRVKNLKKRDARIIMTAMYEDKARELLCAAYKVGLFGPKIVWVFVGWFSSTFWKRNLDNLDCTENEMSMAAEGSFITGPVFSNPVEERGIANLTAREFAERYYNHPAYKPESKDYDSFAYQCYDHIWVAAMALDCTSRRLEQMGHTKTLDLFDYTDSDINEIIFQCLGNTSLTGVSGRVFFTSGADPNRIVKIERIQGDARQTVGLYRQDKHPKYFEWIDGAVKWKDNVIPRDSTYITYEEKEIPATLYMTMTLLASLGISLTISCFVFNVMFRTNSYVKLSSPNINNVLLLGCVLCYSTVFFKITSAGSDIICKIRLVCFSLGFTVTFGALFSKTWRVYRIFTNKKLLKRTIKDYQLLAIIGVFVGLVSVVLILWQYVGPHRTVTKVLPAEIYMIGNDAEVRPYVRVCQSEYSDYFAWPLYVLEGGLLTFGAFLAWETRKVKIQALNDSHEIGLCIYNVVILSAIGLTLSLILEDQEILMYGITSGFLIIGTFLTQAVIFIPKIQAVRNKVSGTAGTIATGINTGINPTSTHQGVD